MTESKKDKKALVKAFYNSADESVNLYGFAFKKSGEGQYIAEGFLSEFDSLIESKKVELVK